MALTKAKKNEKVQMLAKELESSTSAIIGTFAGLNASKDFELRKTVRAAGGHYHVVKNKLAARSSQGTKVEAALQGLKGVSSVAYTSGDPVALAKALSTWVKDNAEFTFRLGIVDGKVINVQEIESLSKLPGKEELFSKLLFLINSPAQRLATVMNATGRDLAVVVNQAVEQGKFTGAAAAPAPAAAESQPEAEAAEAPVVAEVAAPTASEAPAVTAEAPAVGEVTEVSETPLAGEASEAAVQPEVVATESEATASGATAGDAANSGTPESEALAAHTEEAAAGEQPSGAAQPENATASQAGEAAGSEPAEG